MRKLILGLALLLLFFAPSTGSQTTFGGIHLLEGYSVKRGSAIDAAVWTIEGKGGLKIHFEAGNTEGLVVDLGGKDKYEWVREQTVCGHRVLVALTKVGIKSEYDLETERNLPPGSIVMVSFPLGGSKSHAANFVARIANSQEMGDVLLMVLTFDPSKSSF
jgi:hypothetical protein